MRTKIHFGIVFRYIPPTALQHNSDYVVSEKEVILLEETSFGGFCVPFVLFPLPVFVMQIGRRRVGL